METLVISTVHIIYISNIWYSYALQEFVAIFFFLQKNSILLLKQGRCSSHLVLRIYIGNRVRSKYVKLKRIFWYPSLVIYVIFAHFLHTR